MAEIVVTCSIVPFDRLRAVSHCFWRWLLVIIASASLNCVALHSAMASSSADVVTEPDGNEVDVKLKLDCIERTIVATSRKVRMT